MKIYTNDTDVREHERKRRQKSYSDSLSIYRNQAMIYFVAIFAAPIAILSAGWNLRELWLVASGSSFIFMLAYIFKRSKLKRLNAECNQM